MTVGYVYVVQVREFLGTNIYKVGRSGDAIKRLKQYPKGSKLLCNIMVSDCISAERLMLYNLSDYIRREYGREYVDIEYKELLKIVYHSTSELFHTEETDLVFDTDFITNNIEAGSSTDYFTLKEAKEAYKRFNCNHRTKISGLSIMLQKALKCEFKVQYKVPGTRTNKKNVFLGYKIVNPSQKKVEIAD